MNQLNSDFYLQYGIRYGCILRSQFFNPYGVYMVLQILDGMPTGMKAHTTKLPQTACYPVRQQINRFSEEPCFGTLINYTDLGKAEICWMPF